MTISVSVCAGKTRVKVTHLVGFLLLFVQITSIMQAQPGSGTLIDDKLQSGLAAKARIGDHQGSLMDSCIQNGVMGVDFHLYSIPFNDHTDDNDPKFKGEFWGKWYTSAMLAYGYKPKEVYKEIIDVSLKGILSQWFSIRMVMEQSCSWMGKVWDAGKRWIPIW